VCDCVCACSISKDGCWFYLAPHSGVFINVTRTKVATTREALRDEWHVPHRGSIDNDGHICERAVQHGYGSVQILGRESSREATAEPGGAPAGRRGWRGAWSIPELVMCSGPCMTDESTSPCPGLPLWRQDGTACACDHAYPLLRCRESSEPARRDPCPSRHEHA